MRMPNITSDICSHCNQEAAGNLSHILLSCTYNDGAGNYLIETADQIIHLNFYADDDEKLPALYRIAAVLSEVWQCQKEKKLSTP